MHPSERWPWAELQPALSRADDRAEEHRGDENCCTGCCCRDVVRRTTHTKENLMEIVEANVGKMEVQLKQWGAKLDELVAKAEEAGTEAKVDYRKSIDDLKSKHRVAQARLDELRAAGGEKWGAFKIGVESAWTELEAAFKNLAN